MAKKSGTSGAPPAFGDNIHEIIARYRSFFDQTSYCIFIHDFEGNFLDANHAALELLGYSRGDISRLNFADIISDDQLPKAVKAIEKLFKTGFMGGLNEFRLRRKDGGFVWVETESSLVFNDEGPIAVQGVARDITPRKNTEDALERSEKFNRSLVEASPVGILYLDAEGIITYENGAMRRMMGVPEGEKSPIIGLKLSDIPPIADAGIIPMMKRVIDGNTITGAEAHYRSLMGKELDMEINAAPLWGPEGKFAGGIVMVTDITERKQIEEALRKAQKIESIGVLAGGIAHDFNNVLTGILGNISMAKLAAEDNPEVSERLTGAEKACFQARDLTRQLLTFSRGGSPVKAPVSLADTVREAARFTLSGSHNRPSLHVDEGLWTVEADEGQIRQVLSNIIINADQAMPTGGTITITARNVEITERMVAADGTFIEPGSYGVITVADEGPGIPGEHLPRIFDPYFTTKQKGSGLGLAVSYSIVRRHDGHIRVESAPHAGSSMMVYLPASGKDAAPRSEAVERDMRGGSGRVLVMDDDDTIRTVARGLLGKLGFEAEDAPDSRTAVARYGAALSSGKKFDAVILDLTIPGGPGGRETAAAILALDPEARLIVSSGYSNDPVMSRYRDFGFRDVLAKPYRLEDLSRVLAKVNGEEV